MSKDSLHEKRLTLRSVLAACSLTLCFLLYLAAVYDFVTDDTDVSLLDNRTLATWDSSAPHFVSMFEDYAYDHAGFREEMVHAKLLLYGKLFDDFSSVNLKAGKKGELYSAFLPTNTSPEFLDAYLNQLLAIQRYCQERSIDFRYMYLPHKSYVYADEKPRDYPQRAEHRMLMKERLQNSPLDIIDMQNYLSKLAAQGTRVFNRQYDVYHWNEYGAYKSMEYMLTQLSLDHPEIMQAIIHSLPKETQEEFDPDKLTVSEALPEHFYFGQTEEPYLLGVKFPIHEQVPSISFKRKLYQDNSYDFASLPRSYHQPHIWSMKNTQLTEGLKLFALQDSYMNSGWPYLIPAFKEYDKVHSYMNAHNFDQYVNVFQPDVVLYEQADYSSTQDFYRLMDMALIRFNPAFHTIRSKVHPFGWAALAATKIEPSPRPPLPESERAPEDAPNKLVDISLDFDPYLATPIKRELEPSLNELVQAYRSWLDDPLSFVEEHKKLRPIHFIYLEEAGLRPSPQYDEYLRLYKDHDPQKDAEAFINSLGYKLEDIAAMSREERDKNLRPVFMRMMITEVQAIQKRLPYLYLEHNGRVYDARLSTEFCADGSCKLRAHLTLSREYADLEHFKRTSTWYSFK